MLRIPLLLLLLTAASASAEIPEPFNTQTGDTQPMSPAEAAAQMDLPEGFHATVFAAEPDVRQPISMALDSRGRLWVAECYTYAEASVGYAMQLRDRVVIFEDADGDGSFDKRTVFYEGMQRLTSVEIGFGGVWVTAPPNVLFIPDRDGDDRPDGEPEIVLDGFDFTRARHTMVNGLRWGPDGWLYGRQGILGMSEVGAPGTPAEQRTTVNVGIWRYHPTRGSFEVVCDGTTNPWGMDWNEYGDLFFINTVIGHLWQAIPGAHFTRMFGEDGNPHVYQLIEQHADHVHWDTREKWSDVREIGVTGASSQAGGGHAHTGLMFYNGGSWPDEYRGKLFTINFHGRRLNRENMVRTGSGYVGKHTPDFAQQADPWFRGIDLLTAPDGSVYVSDWSDTGECHDDDGVNRQSGRIYKITYGEPAKLAVADVAKLSDAELLPLLSNNNEWFARAARKQLQERAERGVELREDLLQMFAESPEPVLKLRALWALHAIGGADAAFLRTQLGHADEYVRAWAIRLLLDDPATATTETHAALAGLANSESSAYVRLALASALQRVPIDQRAAIASPLLAHTEDAADHNLPLMLWYGIEALAEKTPEALLTILKNAAIPTTRQLISRRLGEDVERRPGPLNDLLLLAASKSPAFQQDVLTGLSEALAGWRSAPKPAAWDDASVQFAKVDEARVRELSGVFGDGRALEKLRELALDAAAEMPVRRAALSSLIDARADGLRELCEQLFPVRDLTATAAGGLALNDDPAIADQMLARFPGLTPLEKSSVMAALLTRPTWAVKLLDTIAADKIPRSELTAFHARQINGFQDAALDAKLTEVWGASRQSSADKTALIATWKERLTPESLAQADQRKGQVLYSQICATCHVMYGKGGSIGPDLTGSGRADLDYLLHNIADPSALVAIDYQLSSLTMTDGRVLSGMIRSRNDSIIVLQTLTETLNLQVSDVAKSETSPISIMPEGLLGAFDETQTRDLIAFLMSKGPQPEVESKVGFWSSPNIASDPLFFIKQDGASAATAKLLFTPQAAPDLRAASGETVFEIGRDFTWDPSSREIVLTEASRIPFKTIAELHPAPGTPNSYDGFRDTNLHMLYAQGRFFHDLQSVATYTASEPWPGPVPMAKADQLPHLHARLAAHEPVKIVVLGDSISTGLNASATGDVAPHQPGYPELVTSGLAERFETEVTLKNLSVSGMDAVWGLTQMEAAIAEKPDVFVCAFGMNDASGLIPPEKLAETIRQMIDQLHAANPNCDVILVSPMTANPEWKHAQPTFYPAYAKAMQTLAGPKIVVADVTSIWLALLERKSVLDLSGNGLNHPNDFGHRVYADVVLATIGLPAPVNQPDKSQANTNAEVIRLPTEPSTIIVKKGQSKYVIVTADKPFPIAAYAAKELAHHLELATGAELPIVLESKLSPDQTARIYVGQSKTSVTAKIDAAALPNEVCVLKTIGDDLFIVGHDGSGHELDFDNVFSGTLWGVYEILERLVNARWLWPGEGGIAVEKTKNLSAPHFDEIVKPHLETRILTTYLPWNNGDPVIYADNAAGLDSGLAYSTKDAFKKYLIEQQAFLRRQRMGTSRTPNDSVGHDFIHWWKTYGETHPEWFQLLPEVKGEFAGLGQAERAHLAHGRPESSFAGVRGPDNPADPFTVSMCVSDKGLQNEIIRLWQEERAKHPGEEIPIRVGENDIWGLCICDHCVALDPPQLSSEEKEKLPGSVANSHSPFNAGRRYAIFYQQLHEMAAKIDPNARVLGYAYLNYIAAPKDVKLHPNIVLNFVPWGGYWYPRDSGEQQWLREQWLQWRKLGASLFFRPNYLLDGGSMPHNYQHQMMDQFDFYLHNGCTGTTYDTRPGQWSAQGVTMYALLRKHTRPDASTEQILDEYYSAFGPGADNVKSYFDFWENNSNTNATMHADVWDKRDATHLLTYARVARDLYPSVAFERASQLLDAAQKATEAQPDARQAEYLERLQYLRLGMEHAQKIAVISGLFADKSATPEARRAAFKDLRDFRFASEGKNVANYAQSAADEMRSFGDRYDFAAKIEIDVRPAD